MIGTVEELDRVRDECKSMVTKQSLMSAGAAAVPVPGLDVAADIGLLIRMLPEISKRFGLDHESVSKLDPTRSEQLIVIATSLGNNVIGKVVTKELVLALLKRIGVRVAAKSVTKYIPIIGTAFAASVSFGAMKLVGNRHVDDCYGTVRRMLEESGMPAEKKTPRKRTPRRRAVAA